MKIFLYGLFAIVFLVSCTQKEKTSFNGIWVGSGMEMDIDYFTPSNLLIHFKEDSTFIMKGLGSGKTKNGNWSVKQDSIHIDQVGTYALDFFNFTDRSLKWGERYGVHLNRPYESAVKLDHKSAKEKLLSSVWQAEKEILFFQENGKLLVMDRESKKYKTFCWTTEQYQKLFFLVKKGSVHHCEDQFHFIQQITELTSNKLRLITHRKNGTQENQYVAIANFQKPSDFRQAFQLCNEYLHLNNPRHRYYSTNTKYKGGLYEIRKIVKKGYKPVDSGVNSGLVRVRFIVNCAGQTGNFEVITLDENYKPVDMNPAITEQLLSITKSLDEWIPGNHEGKPLDAFKFLSFRLKNGEIQEIFP